MDVSDIVVVVIIILSFHTLFLIFADSYKPLWTLGYWTVVLLTFFWICLTLLNSSIWSVVLRYSGNTLLIVLVLMFLLYCIRDSPAFGEGTISACILFLNSVAIWLALSCYNDMKKATLVCQQLNIILAAQNAREAGALGRQTRGDAGDQAAREEVRTPPTQEEV